MPKFQIHQIAIAPVNAPRAISLLSKLGLSEWVGDDVIAAGEVFSKEGANEATLHFNYEAGGADPEANKPLEFEVLDYAAGENWIDLGRGRNVVSHLGTHCTLAELDEYRKIFDEEKIGVAQEVITQSHTNPKIKDDRRYKYVIFGTSHILGVDLKFIVRLNVDGSEYVAPAKTAAKSK